MQAQGQPRGMARRRMAVVAVMCLVAPAVWGGLLVQYDFEASSNLASTAHALVTASTFIKKTIGAPGGVDGTASFPNGDDSTYSYSYSDWAGPSDATPVDYWSFSITLEAGFIGHVTNLTWAGNRSGTGPTNWFAYYSTDDTVYHALGSGQTTTVFGDDVAHDITPVDLQGTVYFRIHGTNSSSGSGTWRVDDVTLSGTVIVDDGTRYVAYQSYDGDPADSWGSVTHATNATVTASAERSASGNTSLRIGGTGAQDDEDPSVVFDNVSLSGVSDAVFSIGYAARGPDTDEDLYLALSYDGGATWVGAGSTKLVDGYSSATIAFGATHAANPTTAEANPYEVVIDDDETEVRARVAYIQGSGTATDEYYYVDSVVVRGIPTPSTASPNVTGYNGVSGITTNSANVAYHVTGGYPYPTVKMYYGPYDGGVNVQGWSYVTDLGTRSWGLFTHSLTGLAPGQTHYYRFRVENSQNAAWQANTSSFVTTTVDPPVAGRIYVDNLGIRTEMPLSIDNDGDGLADRWEEEAFGNTDAGGDVDSDGDGMFNIDEFIAATDPNNSTSRLEIVSVDLADEGSDNVNIRFTGGDFIGGDGYITVGDNIQRSFDIRSTDTNGVRKSLQGSRVGLLSATNVYVDTNAVAEATQRFYEISVNYAGQRYTNTQEWGMFVQPRAISNSYLVSVPVDLGTNNTLNGELGQQVARGLSFGTTTTGDKLYLLQADGSSLERVLVTNDVGDVLWWNVQAAAEATDIITPGMGMRLVRESETNEVRTNSVMVGKTYVSNVDPLTFNTNSAETGWTWRLFGWPYAKPIASTGASDPFGFYTNGAYGGIKGGHTADHEDRGDQIWVWDADEQSFRYYYLLDGVDGRADLDGVWWDLPRRTHAIFSLEPGKAYYYRHHVATNGATTGTNFIWQPHMP